MPTFFARRYQRRIEAVGNTEKLAGGVILLLIAAVVVTFVVQAATDRGYLFTVEEPVADNPFPEPGVEGWRAPPKADRFSPDNLYVKIDGRADAYLQFGVVGLTFGAYAHETDAERTIDVYWYDMGQAVNAFGIYRAEASPGADAVNIGRESYQVGGAVFFQQGSSYVQVLPTSPDPGDGKVALEIARRIAARCADADSGLWAAKVLPAAGRIEGSFAYQARDAFGLDFLGDVFTADYLCDGGKITLFIHRAGDRASAEALLDEYVAFFKKYGQVIWTDPDESRRIVAGKVAGLTDVVFIKDRYLGGATGADDLETARRAATGFYEELAAP